LSNCSSLLREVLDLMPQDAIADIIAQIGADSCSRKLPALAQLKVLIVSHLAGRQSLRDVVSELTYNPVLQQEVFPHHRPPSAQELLAAAQRVRIAGLKRLPPSQRWEQLARLKAEQPSAKGASAAPISVSQISRLNAKRPADLWERVAQITMQALAQRCGEPIHPEFGPVRVVDGSVIALSKRFPWANYSRLEKAVRLHVCLDQVRGMTLPPIITTGKVAEQHRAGLLVTEPGVTYLFDRGYTDHKAFSRYCEQGIYFVTRLMPHSVYRVLESRATDAGMIVADETVELGCKIRRVKHPLRVVTIQPPNAEPIKFLTNRFDLSAEHVAELYRKRWDIELFFRWVKQNLRLKHFLGRSESAVYAQLYAAFIAHALLAYVQHVSPADGGMLETLRRVRHGLWSDTKLAPFDGCQSAIARFNAV
jgi:hypothetical protein